ncbi:hypothetical protein RJ639_023422 [Escallonia herrerae]|uniref:Uncharacterized protein n=1 Tax=Escallonia herrerae TaxID=1293975 RepID=A0AA89AEC2_9ASTE|nr:hypothetical protein RJ639_023422 [Escallonia herrerae]
MAGHNGGGGVGVAGGGRSGGRGSGHQGGFSGGAALQVALTAELVSTNGNVIARSSHPCILHFRSLPVRLM